MIRLSRRCLGVTLAAAAALASACASPDDGDAGAAGGNATGGAQAIGGTGASGSGGTPATGAGGALGTGGAGAGTGGMIAGSGGNGGSPRDAGSGVDAAALRDAGDSGATAMPMPQDLPQALRNAGVQSLFPAPNAEQLCPDPPLRITFSAPPALGTAGEVQVFDAEEPGTAVATLDMAQPIITDTIGGKPFNVPRPAYVDGNDAVAYLPAHALAYGRSYIVHSAQARSPDQVERRYRSTMTTRGASRPPRPLRATCRRCRWRSTARASSVRCRVRSTRRPGAAASRSPAVPITRSSTSAPRTTSASRARTAKPRSSRAQQREPERWHRQPRAGRHRQQHERAIR